MPLGPFENFDECVAVMDGRVDDAEAYCGWLKQQTASTENATFAVSLGDVRVGSFVEWAWLAGTAQGQIQSIHTEGPVNVPGVDLTLDADEENPAALIESWEAVGDRYRPTGTIVGRRFASLTRIDPLPEVTESAAFQARPGGGVLPDGYRPADSPDVPDGRDCANCFFYSASDDPDGVNWCMYWEAEVQPDFYCDAWASLDRSIDGDDDMNEAGYKDKDKKAVDPADMVVVETFDADAELLVTTDGRIRAATLVAIPAFVDAKIEALSDDEDDDRWYGVLAPEGVPTGDGRMFERGSIRWDDLPLPLLWAKSMEGGHDGAVVVGTIDTLEREGDLLVANGRFDLGSDDGREAARQVRAGVQRGVSVDLDDVSLEMRVAADMLDDLTVEIVASAGAGGVGQPWTTMSLTSEERRPTAGMAEEAQRALDWRAEGHAGGEDATVGRARSIAAREPLSEDTVRRMNRFFLRNARYPDLEGFKPGDDGYPSRARVAWALWGGDAGRTWSAKLVDRLDRQEATLTASAGYRPHVDWFRDPQLSGPTPLTVTDDGRIYGHLALWGTCHTGFGRECVQPPSSTSGYAFFRTGVVVCDDGTEMPVGRITLDTTHAGRRHGPADTIAHYEHTGLGVAHVAAGEDAYGIWVAGAVAPHATDEQIARLRVSPLSGDWRSVGGQLELVAALAVNTPGFPVPRALVASGRVHSLQASGVVRESDVLVAAASDEKLSAEHAEALWGLVDREVEARRAAKVDEAALKVAAAKAAARVRGSR